MKRLIAFIIILIAGGGGLYYYYAYSKPVEKPQVIQAMISQGDIVEAAFIASGERVLSWQTGGRVQLWDALGGHPLTSALRGAGTVTTAIDGDFGAGGVRLLIIEGDRATLWHLPPFEASSARPALHQEVLTGTRLTIPGEVEVLSAEEWRGLANELAASRD